MNITFFIGNGFDINLGYATKYSDFYPYYFDYMKKNHSDDLLYKEIKKDKENWSDLEMGLGDFHKNIYDGDDAAFIECKNRMDSVLSSYLQAEAKRNVVFTGDAAQEFQNRIVHIDQFLPESDALEYRRATESVADTIHYCFISFNYTHSLDEIIQYTRKNVKQFATHRGGGSIYTDDIVDPIHIHGRTSGEMILGVNDVTQMSKDENVSDELRLAMVKPEINDSLGNRNNAKVQKFIDESKYIVVYGMSLGLTDLKWWKSIFEWLKKDLSRKLVIFHRSKEGTVPSGGETAQRKYNERKKFFAKVGANQEEFEKHRRQVIVQINSPVFDFKKIQAEKKGKVSNGEQEDASV